MAEQHFENSDRFVKDTKKNCDKLRVEMKTMEDRITKINGKVGQNKRPDTALGVEDKYSLVDNRLARLFLIMFLCFIAYHVEIKSRLSQMEQYTWPKILNRMSYLPADSEQLPIVPLTFKVSEYAEKLENNDTWTSPLFITGRNGYITWLSVGFFKGSSLAVSYFFKRSYSSTYQWPQNSMFTLEVLNQQYDDNHLFIPILIDIKRCQYVDAATVRYTTGISTDFLDKTSNQYLKNGNAYLRVSQGENTYTYIEWFMRQYLNLSLSNYSGRLLMIVAMLLLLECQAVCEAHLKEYEYLNQTFIRIVGLFTLVIAMYILFKIGVFSV